MEAIQIGIFTALSIVVFMMVTLYRKSLVSMMIRSIVSKQAEGFYNTFNRRGTKLLVGKRNLRLMEIHLNILVDNRSKVNQIFSQIESAGNFKSADFGALNLLYNYYLFHEDQACSRQILEWMKGIKAVDLQMQKILFEIVFDRSTAYVKEFEEACKTNPNEQMNYYLLHKMYLNKGDEKKADEYLHRYKNYIVSC